MISILAKGGFKKTQDKLARLNPSRLYSDLDAYGKLGVEALSQATPMDTSLTKNSWDYRVIKSKRYPGIHWFNTNVEGNTPVAILIQYGHATGTGGYVAGRDYINPAMRPVFDRIAADVWKKVTA